MAKKKVILSGALTDRVDNNRLSGLAGVGDQPYTKADTSSQPAESSSVDDDDDDKVATRTDNRSITLWRLLETELTGSRNFGKPFFSCWRRTIGEEERSPSWNMAAT